jgi:AcrR family transcriptional regulator
VQTSPSLRERNRIETTHSIHQAAAELVLANGLTETTVEAIASQAGVSKRTFFNYFATKEDAVLGSTTPVLEEDAVRAFAATDEDLLSRTVRLLVSVLDSAFQGGSSLETRRTLLNAYPELRQPLLRQLTAVEQLVESALEERLRGDSSALAGLPAIEDAPKALLKLAGAAIRFTVSRQPGQLPTDLGAAVDESIHIFREVLQALR